MAHAGEDEYIPWKDTNQHALIRNSLKYNEKNCRILTMAERLALRCDAPESVKRLVRCLPKTISLEVDIRNLDLFFSIGTARSPIIGQCP
jgi:hypothetical protein